ncbi:MAG: hypothetical protein ACE5K0_05775, partial [Candidatus Methanofastidiosia archaeon]
MKEWSLGEKKLKKSFYSKINRKIYIERKLIIIRGGKTIMRKIIGIALFTCLAFTIAVLAD